MDRILVGVDGSEPGYQALEYALAQFPDAEIHAVFVPDIPPPVSDPDQPAILTADEQAGEILPEARARASAHDRTIETDVCYGRPAAELSSYADDYDTDHIVVGSRGTQDVRRLLLGSVAESVVRRAQCPVTVVR